MLGGGGCLLVKKKNMLGRLLEKKMCCYTRENPLHLRPKKENDVFPVTRPYLAKHCDPVFFIESPNKSTL